MRDPYATTASCFRRKRERAGVLGGLAQGGPAVQSGVLGAAQVIWPSAAGESNDSQAVRRKGEAERRPKIELTVSVDGRVAAVGRGEDL